MADPDATLVVDRGRAAAAEVAERLIEAGLDAATPVMVVENASLSQDRRFSTRLDLLGLAVKTAIGKGPALLLIGKAVAAASSPALADKRSEEHTSALPSLMRTSYADLCLKKNKHDTT